MAGQVTLLQLCLALTGFALVLLAHVTPAATTHGGHRLICWQAILKCQGEEACNYAYHQYTLACAPVISGRRRKCPSHCISSLVQLNLTANGPLLEDCECASDARCTRAQRAIEPCVPRLRRAAGCTEARRRCEDEPACRAALGDYLHRCRKLLGGARCSEGCRRVIARLRALPAARMLDTCVCDGAERAICEHVKGSMRNFCPREGGGSGGGGGDQEEEEEEEEEGGEEEEEEWRGEEYGEEEVVEGCAPCAPAGHAMLIVAGVGVALVTLLGL